MKNSKYFKPPYYKVVQQQQDEREVCDGKRPLHQANAMFLIIVSKKKKKSYDFLLQDSLR